MDGYRPRAVLKNAFVSSLSVTHKLIQRVDSSSSRRLENVGIDHGGGNIAMPQQLLLPCANIRTGMQKMRGEAMTQQCALEPAWRARRK